MHAGQGEDDLLHLEGFEAGEDILVLGEDGDAVDLPLGFALVIVDEADGGIGGVLVGEELLDQHGADAACTHHRQLFASGGRDNLFFLLQHLLSGFIGVVARHEVDDIADARQGEDAAAAIFKHELVEQAGGDGFQQVEGDDAHCPDEGDAHGAFGQEELDAVVDGTGTHICKDQPDVEAAAAVTENLPVDAGDDAGGKHAHRRKAKLHGDVDEALAHLHAGGQVEEDEHRDDQHGDVIQHRREAVSVVVDAVWRRGCLGRVGFIFVLHNLHLSWKLFSVR